MINTSPRVMVLVGKGMMTSQTEVLFLCPPTVPLILKQHPHLQFLSCTNIVFSLHD